MKNLAFFQDKLIDSLFYALKVAKKLKVHVATLPDLIKIRTGAKEDSMAWDTWLTPLTTLYFGVYQDKRIIVVAHHLGPLTTKKRILQWAKSGVKDKGDDRVRYGSDGLPKITQQEFNDLVEGKYGEVIVIDFNDYSQKFISHLGNDHIITNNALADPLLKALLGSEMEKFVEKHYQISHAYAVAKRKQLNSGDKIFRLGIKDRYGWDLFSDSHCDFPDKQPIGLFLNLGRPSYWANHDLSVSTEIRTHEDLGCARFIVLNDVNDDIADITYSPFVHWKKCLVKSEESVPNFFVLSKGRGKYFAQYPKDGDRMDTGEIMFEVTNLKKIGEQTFFTTPIHGSPFLKYHIDEVMAIAPVGSNAYMICGAINPGEIVKVPVQFFKVEINNQYRILREKEVASNLPLLLQING